MFLSFVVQSWQGVFLLLQYGIIGLPGGDLYLSFLRCNHSGLNQCICGLRGGCRMTVEEKFRSIGSGSLPWDCTEYYKQIG